MTPGPARFLAHGRCGDAAGRSSCSCDPLGVTFIVSPLIIGLLAQATSLRLALAVLVWTSLAIAGLATRWPAVCAP
jgi:hypothetical protein